jgi:hypothetical protein
VILGLDDSLLGCSRYMSFIIVIVLKLLLFVLTSILCFLMWGSLLIPVPGGTLTSTKEEILKGELDVNEGCLLK